MLGGVEKRSGSLSAVFFRAKEYLGLDECKSD